MFWLRVLAIAQLALLVRHHLALLNGDERSRLAVLVARSRGRPRRNLSADERAEMLGLVQLEPGSFARGAWGATRGRVRGKP